MNVPDLAVSDEAEALLMCHWTNRKSWLCMHPSVPIAGLLALSCRGRPHESGWLSSMWSCHSKQGGSLMCATWVPGHYCSVLRSGWLCNL